MYNHCDWDLPRLDFVPISDSHASVTMGLVLNRLTRIQLATYKVLGGRVQLDLVPSGVLVCAGGHHRLGHLLGTRKTLIYSNSTGVVGAPGRHSPTAHQPYVHEGELYYTDDWPNVRIYKGHEVFLDHFDGYTQVGNPHWGTNGMLYFEARRKPDPRRPEAWEVWQYDPRTGVKRKVCQGANPAYWNRRLFWGEWNGRNFTYRCRMA